MQENDIKTIILDENLSVKAAETLFESLCEYIGQPLDINAAEVKHLDAPCAQLLVSAKMSFESTNTPFEITAPSVEFIESLTTLGLAESLSLIPELDHVS